MKVIKNTEAAKSSRRNQRFITKESQTSAKYLRRVQDLTGTPRSLSPFTDILKRIYVDMEGVKEEASTHVVGTYCVMAPQELIYAAGAQPVKLCSGNYTSFSVGDDMVPRDACPLVKAVIGFKEMNLMPLYDDCSMMAIPITCDCKKKIAGMLEDKCRVMTMHIPAEREDEDIDEFVLQLYDFVDMLEEVTGNKVTHESLSEGMRKVAQAQYELSRFIELKQKYPYIIKGTHAMTILNASSYMTADKWAAALHQVNHELTENAKNNQMATKRELPRILLTGSPIVFPNMKIPLLIEEMGGFLAGDETCMGERGLWDPAVPIDDSFDGMMRALANRSLRPCPCPTFADNSQRLFRLKQMVKDNQIEGIIYHVLRGCLVYDYEYKMIEEEMGKMDIPIIRVESDYNEEDIEQLRIRIEAFIELIKLRKEPVRRTEARTAF